jgi:SSS family solute:Na+ symporter
MVSGMFIPVLAALFLKNPNPVAALSSMIAGGGTTLVLIISGISLPLGLDANIFGIGISILAYWLTSLIPNKRLLLSR